MNVFDSVVEVFAVASFAVETLAGTLAPLKYAVICISPVVALVALVV